MATWQATNVNTGAVEGPKYNEIGSIEEIWKVSLTTALANGDTILGPSIPAGVWLSNVLVDTGQLDSNGSPTISFEVGTSATPAQFIAASTIARAGGIQGANVAGTVGYSPASATQVIATITAAAATAKAGTFVLKLTYTANP